jgi:Fe-S oxidoreductase
LKLRERLFSSMDELGRWGCKMPRLANAFLDFLPVRLARSRLFDITNRRPLPRFARMRFDHWFAKHQPATPATRSRVILWDDTFTRYYEPHVGMSAVAVLEAAGFAVTTPTQRQCCGRPAFSQGNLDEAAKLGGHNLALLNADTDGAPIIFLEPSCFSMFVEDYRELKLPDVENVARRCFLFEDFIENFLNWEPGGLKFNNRAGRLIIHPHCHARALASPNHMRQLAERLPEKTVTLLDTGCCGMAGTFGLLESKYELSVKTAEPIIQIVRNQPFGTTVVASGASCRQQIQHLAPIRLRHMAEILAESLV